MSMSERLLREINQMKKEITETQEIAAGYLEEVERLTRALDNIRVRCFDDSEWARYIDKVLGERKSLDGTPVHPRRGDLTNVHNP